jgi:hypothetical protein
MCRLVARIHTTILPLPNDAVSSRNGETKQSRIAKSVPPFDYKAASNRPLRFVRFEAYRSLVHKKLEFWTKSKNVGQKCLAPLV